MTGSARLGAGGAVRGHLLLDPAPLLGPGHPLPRRLRRRRRADAAVRWRPRGHQPPDAGLHARACGCCRCWWCPWPSTGWIYGGAAVGPRGRFFVAGVLALRRTPPLRCRWASSPSPSPTSACCSAALALDTLVRTAGRWPRRVFQRPRRGVGSVRPATSEPSLYPARCGRMRLAHVELR